MQYKKYNSDKINNIIVKKVKYTQIKCKYQRK
jgi:hypothetical protein